MSDPIPIDQVRRHLLVHARMLRGAGIDWLRMSELPWPAPTAPASGACAAGPSEPIPLATASNITPAVQPSLLVEIADEGLVAAGNGMTLDERRTALQVLAADVKACTRCAELCSTRTQTVFGQGLVGAEVCFVGEAPGADEDAQGLPFVGAAGQLLNRIIAACAAGSARKFTSATS